MKVSMSNVHLQAVFSAQCKITSFPIRAQTPSAPHSGTESRRSTETRTAQSGAASEDSAHGCQFASAAASPSRTPSPRQTRPDVSRPTQRDESSHTGGPTATRRQSPHTSGHPRSGTRTRRKSPYHLPAHENQAFLRFVIANGLSRSICPILLSHRTTLSHVHKKFSKKPLDKREKMNTIESDESQRKSNPRKEVWL